MTNDQIVEESTRESRDHGSRVLLVVIAILMTGMLIAFGVASLLTYRTLTNQAERGTTLAQELKEACLDDDIESKEIKKLCGHADEVVEKAPEFINEVEIQEPEIQEPENQEPEIQEPEIQDPENNDFDPNDLDPTDDPEVQDEEIQEPEIQDPEIQDPEIDDPDPNDPDPVDDPDPDDPENDDPDPASPFKFTFTFTIPGNGINDPGRTYTVICDSGTGDCTVTQRQGE